MKTKRLYQKQILPAAVGREVLAVQSAELKSADNKLPGRGAYAV